MEKKELKEFINNNGGFISMQVEGLDTEGMTAEAIAAKNIPEGTKFFSGIASNADLNRNGYMIILEAWANGIKAYMENPVVLLGHDMKQPIGRCTKMEITKNGLYVEGYVFDEYSEGRIGKGLITTLSTGHYTKAYDFLNLKTGQIITKQEFRQQYWAFHELDEKHVDYIDKWVQRITETEIVEFSFVSIPANRKSHVTVKESLQKWYEAGETAAPVAKNTETVDNLTVTKNTMKHILTEENLKQFPGLAERFNAGDEISGEAWEMITGEKLEPKEVAVEEPTDTTAGNGNENVPGAAAAPAAPAAEAATAQPTAEAATVDAENAATPTGQEEVKPNAEAGNAEAAVETKTEKVLISKEDRAKLQSEAEAAAENAERLRLALEGTTDGEEDEEAAATPAVEVTKKAVLDVEALNKAVGGLVEIINTQQEQISHMTKALENVPDKKSLILHSQFGEAAKTEAETAKAEAAKTDEKTKGQLKELNGLFAASGVVPSFKQ